METSQNLSSAFLMASTLEDTNQPGRLVSCHNGWLLAAVHGIPMAYGDIRNLTFICIGYFNWHVLHI